MARIWERNITVYDEEHQEYVNYEFTCTNTFHGNEQGTKRDVLVPEIKGLLDAALKELPKIPVTSVFGVVDEDQVYGIICQMDFLEDDSSSDGGNILVITAIAENEKAAFVSRRTPTLVFKNGKSQWQIGWHEDYDTKPIKGDVGKYFMNLLIRKGKPRNADEKQKRKAS